jgi:hypothetical protein
VSAAARLECLIIYHEAMSLSTKMKYSSVLWNALQVTDYNDNWFSRIRIGSETSTEAEQFWNDIPVDKTIKQRLFLKRSRALNKTTYAPANGNAAIRR